MTEPNSYIPQESPNLEFVYNNESELKSFYWPLFWSEYEIPQQANQLFNDYDSDYITYSGDSWKSLMVSKEKDGRYKNFTLRAYSGDSFNFYLSAGSLVDGVETYYSGPVTASGNYSVLTSYSGQSTAEANAVSFTAPGDNTTVYTFPQVSTINFVKLYHQASTVSGEYRLYQFLPRTLIQVDDLEADVISAVTVRVQDSIVIGPDMIGDKTLLGRKIVDGTLSGILLTDGTITGSKIQANTISGVLITGGTITGDKITAGAITADKINVTNLSAVNANTGNLSVNGTLSITSGEIDAGLTTINQTGIEIGAINSTLPITNALRIYGSGSSADVNGVAFYNGVFSPTTPLFQVNLDAANAVEFENNQPTGGLINFNFQPTSTSTSLQLFNGDFNLKRSSDSTATAAPSIVGYNKANSIRYQITDTLISSSNLQASSTVKGPSIQAVDSGGNTISTFSNAELNVGTTAYFLNNAEAVAGGQFIVRDNSNYARVQASQNSLLTRSSANAVTFSVNTDNGNTRVYGGLTVDLGTTVGGTLTANGTLDVNANFLQDNYGQMTKNLAQTVNAGTDAKITFQVSATGGDMDDTTNSRLNITYAGLYLLTAGLVSSNVTSQTWQVVTGGAYGTGTVLNGVTQIDNRAYTSKLLYLAANTQLELWIRNSSATNMTVTTGVNGTILSIVKVG